mgnify:CR=1 FL=1
MLFATYCLRLITNTVLSYIRCNLNMTRKPFNYIKYEILNITRARAIAFSSLVVLCFSRLFAEFTSLRYSTANSEFSTMSTSCSKNAITISYRPPNKFNFQLHNSCLASILVILNFIIFELSLCTTLIGDGNLRDSVKVVANQEMILLLSLV